VGAPLLISKTGDAAAVAPRIGADLLFLRSIAKKRKLFEGISPLRSTLTEALRERPRYIVYDQIGSTTHPIGPQADALRYKYPIYGCGAIQEALELDRAFALRTAVECGIKIPRTFLFDPGRGKAWDQVDPDDAMRVHRIRGGLKEAQRFVATSKKRWCLKPLGNAAPSLSYVAHDPDDMLHRLRNAEEKRELKPGDPFLLQEFVSGIEVSTEIWIVDGVPAMPVNGTLEEKKFMAGGVGPNIGCASSVVWAYEGLPRIYRKTLGRPEFLSWLKKPTGPTGKTYPPFHGPLDINCVIAHDDHQPYMLEFSPRFGYSALFALLELCDEPLDRLFEAAARGTLERMALRSGYAYSLRVSIPPYPHLDALDYTEHPGTERQRLDNRTVERMLEECQDVDILGPCDDPHVWLLDAQKDGDHYQTAGVDGVVLELTGSGDTVELARDQVNALFNEFRIADMQARITDGADRAIRDLKTLEEWGYEVARPAQAARPAIREAVHAR